MKSGRPLWRVPRNSPGPLSLRSCSAITKPSLVATMTCMRCLVASLLALVTRIQYDWSAPRPTRPRSWWSWLRPKRSAFSITMTEALGTSTPTSMTVVATRMSSSWSRKARITASFSSEAIWPCKRPTR
ncbi:hypothetical protein D3C87_1765270 [compost metagenome]